MISLCTLKIGSNSSSKWKKDGIRRLIKSKLSHRVSRKIWRTLGIFKEWRTQSYFRSLWRRKWNKRKPLSPLLRKKIEISRICRRIQTGRLLETSLKGHPLTQPKNEKYPNETTGHLHLTSLKKTPTSISAIPNFNNSFLSTSTTLKCTWTPWTWTSWPRCPTIKCLTTKKSSLASQSKSWTTNLLDIPSITLKWTSPWSTLPLPSRWIPMIKTFRLSTTFLLLNSFRHRWTRATIKWCLFNSNNSSSKLLMTSFHLTL